jgi:aquaporin Z
MVPLSRRLSAEALGTFALVFIGAGSVMSQYFPKTDYGTLGIAIAHGLVLAVMVTAAMDISGGHLNPAVTLGLLVARRITIRDAAAYIVTQLAAATIAAAVLQHTFPGGVLRAGVLGTPRLAPAVSLMEGIAIEAILTFFLVSSVFGTSPNFGGFGIGLTWLVCMLVGGPLTGAVVNPARAFGPALISHQWVAHIVWWVGPILGGVLAALVWEYWLLPGARRKG